MSDKVIITDEKQFVYRDSHNKGHIQTPSMVENCIGLSNHSKTIYSNILNHIYEKGHSAFPSTYKLAISCSCSVNSVITYINELVEKELIDKQSRGRGRSNHYFIRDCKDVPLLHVSEMFWKAMSKLTNLYGWKSVLPAKEHILKYMAEVNYPLQSMEVSEESYEELMFLLKHALKGGVIEMGLLPRNMKFQKPSTTPDPVEVPQPKAEVSPVRRGDSRIMSPTLGVSQDHWAYLPTERWSATHFKEYYYDKYLDMTEQIHPRNIKKHTGIMRRIFKTMQEDKNQLKHIIDGVFEVGFDNVTLDYLSSNRIGEVQTFITNGKVPFYLEKKRNTKVDVIPEEQRTTMASKDLFNKVLGGGDK